MVYTEEITHFITAFVRYAMPVLSVVMLTCSFRFIFKSKTLISAFLLLEDSTEVALSGRETLVGSSDYCDIQLNGTAKEEAVISIKGNSVFIRPLKNREVYVNKKRIFGEKQVGNYDVISVGKREFSVRRKLDKSKKSNTDLLNKISFLLLLVFETLIFVQFCFILSNITISVLYAAFIVFQCVYAAILKLKNITVEISVFYLVSLGFTVTAGIGSSCFIKQLLCFAVGTVAAMFIYIALLSENFGKKLRLPAVIFAIALFAANIITGSIYNGSQSWIEIGKFSFQPSEIVKIILVFLSAASEEILEKKHNTLFFSLFSLGCVAVLAYLSDFGTAAVYFAVFLTVILLRRCSWRLFFTALGLSAAVLTVASVIFPYIAKRIFSFGHAWENVWGSGYQQTRTMIAVASGGFFGVGINKGYLREVAAFDTDIVFGTLSEEFGIVISLSVVVCFVMLALYSLKIMKNVSPFCAVPVCAAAMLFLVQTSLNVFGSLDMLPFTGVTLPFISNGGSSMISSVAMIAFFKSAERNAEKIR